MIQTNVSLTSDAKDTSLSNLMSVLRYNSKHLNDDTTPKAIRNTVMAD